MTSDQLISTIAIVLTAAAGIALLVQMERTHRRSADLDPRRSGARAGERLHDDADHRRLARERRSAATGRQTVGTGSTGTSGTTGEIGDRAAADTRPRPAGVTSLSRPTAPPARYRSRRAS